MARSSVGEGGRAARGANATRVDGALRVVFVGASSLGPMATICFERLALKSRATAVFAARGRPPAPQAGQKSLAASPAIRGMMNEMGVHRWKTLRRSLNAALVRQADMVITLARSDRPRATKVPGVPRRIEHWTLPLAADDEPASTRPRHLRDALRTRVAMLVFMEGWGRPELTRAEERVARPTAAEGHHPFVPMSPFLVEPHASHPG